MGVSRGTSICLRFSLPAHLYPRARAPLRQSPISPVDLPSTTSALQSASFETLLTRFRAFLRPNLQPRVLNDLNERDIPVVQVLNLADIRCVEALIGAGELMF